jgi:hypothetical protein
LSPRPCSDAVWDEFAVVNLVDTIVLRVVLSIAQSEITRECGSGPLEPLLNSIAHLLRTSLDTAVENRGDDDAQRWAVVCVFVDVLAKARCELLLSRDTIAYQLAGFDHGRNPFNSVQTQFLLLEIFKVLLSKYRRRAQREERQSIPSYICPWAYRYYYVLSIWSKIERACWATLDASSMTARWDEGGHMQRRLDAIPLIGLASVACGRFKLTTVTNQCNRRMRGNVAPPDLSETLLDQGVLHRRRRT